MAKSNTTNKKDGAKPLTTQPLISLDEQHLKTLSAQVLEFKVKNGLDDFDFKILVKPRLGAAKHLKPCPPGYHLEIDPDTGEGICVKNKP